MCQLLITVISILHNPNDELRFRLFTYLKGKNEINFIAWDNAIMFESPCQNE